MSSEITHTAPRDVFEILKISYRGVRRKRSIIFTTDLRKYSNARGAQYNNLLLLNKHTRCIV